MVYGTTSSGRIIAKIYRDLRLQDPNWESDAIEWMGEALGLIGVGPQLERKEVAIAVDDFTAEIPTDFVRPLEVLYFPNVEGLDELDKSTAVPLSYSSRTNPPDTLQGIDPAPNVRSFHFSGSNIITSFTKGVVHLVYYGMVLDEMGYPMVPDDPSFGEAFLWYIQMKMMLRGWQSPAGLGYEYAKREWEHYCRQARTKVKMPSLPAMDEFLRNWTRMVSLRDRRLDYFISESLPAWEAPKYGLLPGEL